MAPSFPPVASNATLHALTERLASHSQSLPPLIGSQFTSALSLTHNGLSVAAAGGYKQPAPPPLLPKLQLIPRHQDPSSSSGSVGMMEAQAGESDGVASPTEDGYPTVPNGADGHYSGAVPKHRCSIKKKWPEAGKHDEQRCGRCSDDDMEGFIWDMGVVMRREFDSWVEQCWAEAFHHLFTHTLPTLVIQLILTGIGPSFLRQKIIHGGPDLDHIFQMQMLDIMWKELDLRLSGSRPTEASSSSALPSPFVSSAGGKAASGLSAATEQAVASMTALIAGPSTSTPKEGVCFLSLAYDHGAPLERDDHAMCLCQLISCLDGFRVAAESRRGAVSPLPLELAGQTPGLGWIGAIETPEQARVRKEGIPPARSQRASIPEGKGFVRNPRPQPALKGYMKIPQMFPHPQMTDMLAVEEHLRWRLKEIGASDPAVEARYGPSKNDSAAFEGIDMHSLRHTGSSSPSMAHAHQANGGVGDEESEDGTENGSVQSAIPPALNGPPKPKSKLVRVTRGKGKIRRAVSAGVPPKKAAAAGDTKKDDAKSICYLPEEWMAADPGQRNTAIVLTFRHFVRLLHQIATSVTPFAYAKYALDIDVLEQVHPIAIYRRLTEPIAKRKDGREYRAWQDCMDRWAEELGAREKAMGNKHVADSHHASAVDAYTRAISLDPKKTVYFSNRAVALNVLRLHERAEADCTYILSKDGKNGKAFYQRAVARRGMGFHREAEADLREVLKWQQGNESAKKLLSIVQAEIALSERHFAGL